MSINQILDDEQSLISPPASPKKSVNIPNAPSVRLQTLDLERNIALDPSGKRYVIATFDDTRMGRGYITALYPQQNSYLTLYRLVIREWSSENAELAIQQHIRLIQKIQRGELADLIESPQ